jgi:seryl-tRNA synthetase
MSDKDQERRSLLERLERERDELKLQIGLAKLEAREEWQELQDKLDGLRGRMKVLGSEARDASADVGTAFDLVADEIKEGIGRLKKLL